MAEQAKGAILTSAITDALEGGPPVHRVPRLRTSRPLQYLGFDICILPEDWGSPSSVAEVAGSVVPCRGQLLSGIHSIDLSS